MPRTVTVEVDAELVERFRAARERRREAGDEDHARRALDAERDAALWLALAVDNGTMGEV